MNAYQDKVLNELHDDLDLLTTKYDSRTLATALILRGCVLLRGLIAAGLWTDKDARDVLAGATEEAFTPVPAEERPKVSYTGGTNTLN